MRTMKNTRNKKEELQAILSDLTKEKKLATYAAIGEKIDVTRQRATELFSSYKTMIEEQVSSLKASMFKERIAKAFHNGVPDGISISFFINAIDLPFVNSKKSDYIKEFMKPYGVHFSQGKGNVKSVETVAFVCFLNKQNTSELNVDEIVELVQKQKAVDVPKAFISNPNSFLSKNKVPFKKKPSRWSK